MSTIQRGIFQVTFTDDQLDQFKRADISFGRVADNKFREFVKSVENQVILPLQFMKVKQIRTSFSILVFSFGFYTLQPNLHHPLNFVTMTELFKDKKAMDDFLKSLRLDQMVIDQSPNGYVFVRNEYAGEYKTLPDGRVTLELLKKFAPEVRV